MPEHKHTPGPWSRMLDKNGRHQIIAGGVTRIADLWSPPVGSSEANANLIHSAPDLLEALEELDAMYARAWDTTTGALWFSPESVAKFEEAHEKACAAIAKATGQA